MKKALSIILAALMLSASFALTACSGGNGDETTPETTGETTGETTADTEAETTAPETEAETTAPETEAETAAPETEAETEAPAPAESNEGTIFDQMSEWHYTTFVCPYTDGEGVVGGGAANGHFEEADDEMAAFIKENPEWYKDTALMEKWDVVEAPFGDCINSMLAAQTDFVLDPTNTNGLMTYKTFTIDDLGDDMYYTWDSAYDNAIHVYLNGTEVYTDDGECVATDWQDGLFNLDKAQISDVLKEGENYFVVTIKDAWGGRNFDAGFSAEWH